MDAIELEVEFEEGRIDLATFIKLLCELNIQLPEDEVVVMSPLVDQEVPVE